MIVQANGVLVAPANTATNPMPVKSAIGNGMNKDNALPKAAPIKNNGVTSPPLKPAANVMIVKAIFNAKSYAGN